MKKLVSLGLIVALVLAMGTTAFAMGNGQGGNFVDSDGDSVCDNIGLRVNFVDLDGDGIFDNTDFGIGCGKNGGKCRNRN
ncbi:MAG: hypothetical protein R3Y24_03240 [Eubacteriales bacterium]